MKAWIRKWLGLKDTHSYFDVINHVIIGIDRQSYLNVSEFEGINPGDVIEVSGKNYIVENIALKLQPLEVKNDT